MEKSSLGRHQKVLDLFIKNKSVPHAILFYGGVADTRRDLAISLFFKINYPDISWREAESLQKEDNNKYASDIFWARVAEDKKEISIAQMRELKDFVAKTPATLANKVAIINGTESMNEEAWNSVLKTLEEPRKNTYIFLLGRSKNNIPKTILSRIVSFYCPDSFYKPEAKDDIMLVSRLLGLRGLNLESKFELAEALHKRSDIVNILDWWIMAEHKAQNPQSFNSIELIGKSRNIIASTNANARLVLESLFIRLN